MYRYVTSAAMLGSAVFLLDAHKAHCNPNPGFTVDPKEPTLWYRLREKINKSVGHFWSSTPQVTALPTDKLKCEWNKGGAPRPPVVIMSCGSFNPPTLMHTRMLDLARDVLKDAGYDVLGSYMSPVNDAYWKKDLVPAVHRVKMCQLASESSDHIMVDAWEAQQHHYTRTLQVLQQLESRLNEVFTNNDSITEQHDKTKPKPHIHVRTMLVCGADVLQSMTNPVIWKQDFLEKLLMNHGLVCISRNGSGVDAAAVLMQPGTVLNKYKENIVIVEDPIPNMISSSLVRNELEGGRTVKYLVHDAVLDYIYEHRLYGAFNRYKLKE